MATHDWPPLHEEDRWLTEALEERFEETGRSPEELRARARELREQAAKSEIKGVRDAALSLARHYEEAAAARPAAG